MAPKADPCLGAMDANWIESRHRPAHGVMKSSNLVVVINDASEGFFGPGPAVILEDESTSANHCPRAVDTSSWQPVTAAVRDTDGASHRRGDVL